MKKLLIIYFLSQLFFVEIFSQNSEQVSQGDYIKRVEYNLSPYENFYNFNCKDETEKFFFGDLNAPVEFFLFEAFEGPSCFRILKHLGSSFYTLEVKYVANYKEAYKESYEKYIKNFMISKEQQLSLSEDSIAILKKKREEMINKEKEERFKLYHVETLTFPISDQFADEFYKKMVFFIDNVKAKRDFPYIDGVLAPIKTDSGMIVERGWVISIKDGYSVSFRTVVEDEVWSLSIRMPLGNALKMSDTCRQIISNAINNEFDEEYCFKLLNDL